MKYVRHKFDVFLHPLREIQLLEGVEHHLVLR
jgi:hypothetical protein